DREIGRLLGAVRPAIGDTLIIAAGDHGEAFGEHGEYAHSIFVYDTTLRVPLVMSGPGIRAGTRVAEPVTLADVAPTVMRLLGATMTGVDGVDLSPALDGMPLTSYRGRELYTESFAPAIEFGWAPLRAIRSGPWKLVAAPKPELFDIDKDPGEQMNLFSSQPDIARALADRVNRYSGPELPTTASADARSLAEARLREPDSPSVIANIGILQAARGDLAGAIQSLIAALAADPDLHEARFNLALAYAKSGRRSDAAAAARELWSRLP